MKNTSYHIAVILTLDFLLFIFCLFNLHSVVDRAKSPFTVFLFENKIIVKTLEDSLRCGTLHVGDQVLLWNTYDLDVPNKIEFLADIGKINDQVLVTCTRGNIKVETQVVLLPFYRSLRFIIIITIVGFVVWCMGIFVAINRLEGLAGHTLHWALIGLGCTLLLTQGKINIEQTFTIIHRITLLIVYLSMAALFLFFSTVYPKEKYGTRWMKLVGIGVPTLISTGWCIRTFVFALQNPNSYVQFDLAYGIYHVILLIWGIGIIVNILVSYLQATQSEERARLQWILWGFVIGQVPFLLCILIPQIFFSRDWLPEEYAAVFLIATPFSFAVSFVKYRLFDIEFVINRSIAYFFLMAIIGLMYGLVILTVSSLLGGELVFSEHLVIVLASVALTLLLNPIRLRLQQYIDQTLFPLRTNYRQAISHLNEKIHATLRASDLAQIICQECSSVIPFGESALYIKLDTIFERLGSYGSEPPLVLTLTPEIERSLQNGYIIALPGKRSDELRGLDDEHGEWLRSIGYAYCLPLRSETNDLKAFILFRMKVPSQRITIEEYEFLHSFLPSVSESLERLQLQRSLIMEQEERQRIEELNRLKSVFVSSVSHELRTPLTSIKMFVETLRYKKKLSAKKKEEYLTIIEYESERLSRLVDHVLDASRIERGVKEYQFNQVSVKEVVKNAAAAMEYQFEKADGVLSVKIDDNIPDILADPDAIEEALVNLLSNALQNSRRQKEVFLTAKRKGSGAILIVKDKGIGIPESEIPKIFDQYYRLKHSDTTRAQGMGLGLSLVKHIVDAHKGTIEVKSKIGQGSEFIIHLPAITRRNLT
jgi:signal transduction histidine kinase